MSVPFTINDWFDVVRTMPEPKLDREDLELIALDLPYDTSHKGPRWMREE